MEHSMTVLKRRTRLIGFRLSDDEYRELESLCASEGARSLSDFVRSSLLKALSDSGGGLPVETEIRRLKRRVSELQRRVRSLAEEIERRPPAAA
jgi:polyhydroxyalkanoate synthesis regulator phasin